MAEIKLKVDPKELKQAKAAAISAKNHNSVLSDEEINSRTLALKKEYIAEAEIPVSVPVSNQVPRPVTAAQAAASPVPVPNKKNSPRGKRKKHAETVAEKNYRRHLIKSIFILLFTVAAVTAAAAGGLSIYLVYRIMDDPTVGNDLHKAGSDYRNADGLGEKFKALSRIIDIAGNTGSTETSAGDTDSAETPAGDDEDSSSGSKVSKQKYRSSGSTGTFGRVKKHAAETARAAQGARYDEEK